MFFLSFFFLVFVEISEISWGVVFIDFSCIPESGDMEVYLYQTESTVSFFFFFSLRFQAFSPFSGVPYH